MMEWMIQKGYETGKMFIERQQTDNIPKLVFQKKNLATWKVKFILSGKLTSNSVTCYNNLETF